MKPVKINFSKIKIPSFLYFEKNNSINSNIFQMENIQNGSQIVGEALLNDLYDNVKK